jgi:hypothetical protein
MPVLDFTSVFDLFWRRKKKGRHFGKITGHLSHPQFHHSLLGALALFWGRGGIWRRKYERLKEREKQWQTTPKNLPTMQRVIAIPGRLTGLWFLPKPAQMAKF